MRYRKISVGWAADERVRTFSDDGKLAHLYVLIHPAMTSVGAMRGTLAGIAAEMGWTPRRLTRALAPAIEAGMVDVNAAACFVGLPKFLKHNAPESPNVCKAWVSAIAGLPECPERDAVVSRCREYLREAPPFLKAFEEAFAKAFGQGFSEAFARPSPNQEQEQEQVTGEGASHPPSMKASSNGPWPKVATVVRL